ncbi:MAG: hypothetical protein HC805_07270 [Alkalinema sp. RL_2_19]|nr:hypothetical protein [Alkalinema sp. RL_2_19]
MWHKFAVLGLSLASSISVFIPIAPAQAVKCADFKTQPEAQAYMEQYGATKLDGDRDGIACEALPKGISHLPRQNLMPRVTPSNIPTSTYRVISVGDGDTLRVQPSNHTQAIIIRLACIDAPEIQQGIYGAQSAKRLKQLLPVGQTVNLNISTTDRYGRKVAEVMRHGNNINLQMVREGQAVVYHQYLSSCGQVTQQQLVQAEKWLNKKRIGFWQQSNPILPQDYRRLRRQ